ncbi:MULTISPECIES: FecCD family ABC transporter permease [Shouchella]|uniref:Iron ABC transporter permease n=2 Tax=Shouchella TaxID=2893057 RepID=A0ABY7WBA8_9BACI|nr:MULTISPECIES: iron ABC transporter permease [Shouchella]MED4130586.1 iron ABC transporter permease [Shouchella miscanthi]WDF05961.1 iron ABC transporter permease [Shouchella hunanensis]
MVIGFLLAMLLVSVLSSVAFGSRVITWNELMSGLFFSDYDSYSASVVRERIPRTIFSLLCGAALGVSGALMQAVTRNPIADPSILGVNTGAALFVVAGLAFFNISTTNQYILFAIVGAMLTALFVYGIGSMGRAGATPLKLVLAGVATSAALSSIVSAIMLNRTYVMDQFRFWQVGSVGSGSWESISTFLPFLVVGLFVGILSASALNALALGDEVATGQGVRTGLLRITAAFAGVLLCGAATALAGPIGFIGLLSAHLIRLLLGADLRYIIPLSAIAGAVILTISDVAGRLIGSPGELEAGVITAFIGAPILILFAMRMKVRSL